VVFACAAVAGIHAGLIPEHLREEPRLGVAFAVAAVVLLVVAAGLTFRPREWRAVATAELALGGLAVAYIASRTTGIPWLDPEPEAWDGVGITSVLIELLGLISALSLTKPLRRHDRRPVLKEVLR
jgi:hypothetical protein